MDKGESGSASLQVRSNLLVATGPRPHRTAHASTPATVAKGKLATPRGISRRSTAQQATSSGFLVVLPRSTREEAWGMPCENTRARGPAQAIRHRAAGASSGGNPAVTLAIREMTGRLVESPSDSIADCVIVKDAPLLRVLVGATTSLL